MTQAKTAEEIAKEIVERWGYYLNRSDLEKTIAKAIREAEAREREACAKIAEGEILMEIGDPHESKKSFSARFAKEIAMAIRSRAAERGKNA